MVADPSTTCMVTGMRRIASTLANLPVSSAVRAAISASRSSGEVSASPDAFADS
jgi:hypothetical protein